MRRTAPLRDARPLPRLAAPGGLAMYHLTNNLVERARSLVLIGPTRVGKTVWARSLGNHAYFGGLFSIDEDLKNVEYAVFDDMLGGLEYWHSYKFWLGAQKQFYATDKYKGKRLINWGRPCIYVHNKDPREDPKADVDWLEGNCDFIVVEDSLII